MRVLPVIPAIALSLGLLTGCDLPSPKPMANGEVIEGSQDLMIGYGRLGPAKVGMTKREALDTGLFTRHKFNPADTCKASALKFKKQFKNVEVRTDTVGTIRSLSVVGAGPKTQYGAGVGSDLADIRGSYGSSLMGPKKVSPKLAVGFVRKDDAWIGFLFDDDPRDTVLDPIILIEVTKDSKPQLQRKC